MSNAQTESPPQASLKSRRSVLLRFSWIALQVYGVICVIMFLVENYLVYPRWAVRTGNWNPEGLDFERVEFPSKDGTKLVGWYFSHPEPQGYMVFYHGNGEDITRLGEFADAQRTKHQLAVLVFDYRGYGQSEGSPFAQGVIDDSHAATQWMMDRHQVAADRLLLWGRSLGGAMAIQAASRFGCCAFIIERTFDTMPNTAAHRYWWLPVKLLMRNRFDSISLLKQYHGPLLQSHGTLDDVVPYRLGKRLFDACPSNQKEFIEMEGIGHVDPSPPTYLEARDRFITKKVSRTVLEE